MRSTTTMLAAMCAALALTVSAAAAQTVPPDRRTFVTFSGPVSLPGITLPAGTYTFRIADSQTDRHIVQVFDKDGMKLYTTLLAIPAQRPEPEGDPVIAFKETPSDRPPAIRYWYYAGDKDGNEFVYPKAQAMQIAKASGEPVMSVDSEDMKSGSMSRVTADAAAEPQPAPAAPPAAAAPQSTPPPTPEQPPAAAPVTPSVPAPSATDTDRPVATSGSLPKTASRLPLVAMTGLLALAAALALRAVRTA